MASNPEEAKRQGMLEKQRQEFMADFQKQRDAMAKETQKASSSASERFTTRTEGIDEKLKKSTIGLVTLDEFRRTRSELEEEHRKEALSNAEREERERDKAKGKRGKKDKKRKERSKLSFAMEEEDEEEREEEERGKEEKVKMNGEVTEGSGSPEETGSEIEGGLKRNGGASPDDETGRSSVAKRTKFSKNPSVDTSFLPDRDRESHERLIREQLRKEWLTRQEATKNEIIEITYSYWDGTGHRKTVECKKGDDIAAFLGKCRSQFPELRGVSVDSLMYIKEDLIIPHHFTFYDFIINKARGKSGPLFSFDVHDDVRMLHDATKERDESHAGKVVERSWYTRNKHIFPASRWEVYDPDKDYGAYRIG